MNIKGRIRIVFAAAVMTGMLSGCMNTQKTSENAETESVELKVFAAASMTETLTQIAEAYKKEPDVVLVFNFDSSGTLKTQIEEGAECDLFISAAQKQMNELDAAKDTASNPNGLDFVASDTRINLLENKVVLVVPEGNPADIKSFSDIGEKCSLIALGNEDVPVGQYSNEVLTNLGLLDKLTNENKITYGFNVKEVTTQVAEGAVDCGIVYATDAFSAGLQIVDQAMCQLVVYPAAVLKNSKHAKEAISLLEYLQGDSSMEIFKSVGFVPVGN